MYFCIQYEEHIRSASAEMEPGLIDENTLDVDRTNLGSDKLNSDEIANNAIMALEKFNLDYREVTLARTVAIKDCLQTQTSELLQKWSKREEYRNNINLKNDSLAYLLNRARDALATVIANEDDGADGKDKKGKKPAASTKKK